MALTRLAFFKLLAAVGLGQEQKWYMGPRVKCERRGDDLLCREEKCDGEHESCPLGHCQKPGIVLVEVWPMSGQSPYKLEQHVCSTCGIVYVPPATEGKG